MAVADIGFVRREAEPVLAAPRGEVGFIGWLRANLFSSIANTILTVLGIALIAWIVPPIIRWAFVDAVWTGTDRDACLAPDAGACWAFVSAKFGQFIYGRYPEPERWRVDLTGFFLVAGLVPMAIPPSRVARAAILVLAVMPIAALILLAGGNFSLPSVALWVAGSLAAAMLPPPFTRPVRIALLVLIPLAALILLTGANFRLPLGFLFTLAVAASLATGVIGGLVGSSAAASAARAAVAVALVVIAGSYFYATPAIDLPIVGTVSYATLVIAICAAIAVGAGGASIAGDRQHTGGGLTVGLWLGAVAIAILLLILRVDFGLPYVETQLWGGLLLTLVVAISGMVASLPLGILLALGRRSKLPLIRFFSIVFIEFWRGVPLITVLFMASVMLPVFLPPGVNFDKLLRALIGVALFTAAYMAETVRGGLQAIPRGQYEAAQALGLNYARMMRLIVLPQALKIVIPGIVNSFISLFKDTSLVLIIGLFDLLGIVQFNFSDANWASPSTPATGYVFAAFVFWAFCFGMSRYSMYTERRLNTGYRR